MMTKNTWYRSKRATKVFTDEEYGYNVVEYHGCPVVKWNDDEIVLNTCGWDSKTTKDRMNQASQEYDLGYYIYQKDFIWYIVHNDITYKFEGEEMRLPRKKQTGTKTEDGLMLPDVWGVKQTWRPKYLDEL